MILVTGGAGFIGSNFILNWLASTDEALVNLDNLAYAGNPENLTEVSDDPRYHFCQADIGNREAVSAIFQKYRPRAVIHFAAESHVDRSISGPDAFFQTNVLGTVNLLTCAQRFTETLSETEREQFRFVHVSTDEVYGSLSIDAPAFTEESPYRPNSPYSASKAASDHAVRAWYQTWGFPVITTHCSNNYGPRQFPEKLIPLVIMKALRREPLPIYGDGKNIRDWLYVDDHCEALKVVLARGVPGQTYNIGGNCELDNLTLVKTLCGLLDEICPHVAGPYADLITFVPDRLGHDRRYAINASKIQHALGWTPRSHIREALRQTVQWYLDNPQWIEHILNGSYQKAGH